MKKWMWSASALACASVLMTGASAPRFADTAFAQEPAGQGRGGAAGRGGAPQGVPLLPNERELAMKIKGSFTLAGVGDLIIRTPITQLAEPGFQGLVKPMRDADVTFANMEGALLDLDTFPYGVFDAAPKGALTDIKNLGVDIMSTANNHSLDADVPGLLETIRLLNEAGIVYAGTGRNLQEARAAHFLNSPKGVIGLVSTFSVDPTSGPSPASTSGATYRNGNTGGRAGLNPLRVNVTYTVTQEQIDSLRQVRDSVLARRGEVFAPVPPAPANEPKDRLTLFGQRYVVGPKPGDTHWEMNQGDLREILRSIKQAKQSSDFVIATIHCHQGNYAFQTYTYDNDTPDFLVEFAHRAIDNGADVFIGHGVHTIRGVEIYKGKPIFYGTNTFIYQYTSSLPQNPGGPLTEAEEEMSPGGAAAERTSIKERMESLLTESRYQDGRLVEVRVHPVDLGQDGTRPLSRLGVPFVPSQPMAQRVLEKLQRLSKPYGTTISIENGTGVIRIPAGQAAPSAVTAREVK